MTVADPRARRRSSPTSRWSTPTTSPTTRTTCASSSRTSTGPRARSSPPTARSSPQSVPTTRRLQVPARVPARRACSRTIVGYQSFVNLVGNTGVEASRTTRCSPGRTPACSSTTSARSSQRQGRHQQRRALAHRAGAADGRGARSTARRARWSRSTCRPARCVAMYSNPTFDPNAARRSRHREGRAAHVRLHQRATRRSPRCRARTASATRRARRSRSSRRSRRIEAGMAHADDRVFPDARRLPAPGHRHQLGNFGGELVRRARSARASSNSCNTTFARLGYELGDDFAARDAAVRDRRPIAPPLDLDPGAVGEHRPGCRCATTGRASRSPGSARATCSPRRSRWRWSRRDRQRRRDHGAARRRSEITNADGKTVQTIEPEAVDDVHARRDRRARSPR